MKDLVASIESGVSVNAVDTPCGEDELGVLKTSSVSAGWFDPTQNKTVVPEDVSRVACPVKVGRAIVSRMNTPQLVGAAGLVRYPVANLYLPDRLWQVEFASRVSAAFIAYWMQTSLYRDRVASAGVGTSASMQNISQDDFRNLRLATPLVTEQRAIASYLDAETAKIDALIAKQEQLIETLRERRDAVIQDAIDGAQSVTVALKRRMVVTDCKHVTAEFVDDIEDSYPLASIRECQGPLLDLRNAKRTTRAFFEVLREGGRDPHPGDLVMTRNASVGLVARVDRDTPDFAMGQDVCLLHPLTADLVDARYAQYILLSHGATEQFELSMTGSTFRRINVDDIRGLRTKWPSGVEQQRIADYLDEQTAKIDALIEKTERFIDLARERRAALIAAAVTGQIDVRDGAA